MMLPTLISVSVAPVSYFLSAASAPPIDAAKMASAAELIAALRIVTAIRFSLLRLMQMIGLAALLAEGSVFDRINLATFGKKSPCDDAAGGCCFSSQPPNS